MRVQVLFLILFLGNIFCREWHSADSGQILWASGCDFHGGDIAKQSGPGDQCGAYCRDNSQCTHFTWTANTCHLKRFSSVAADQNKDGAVCGYLPSRVRRRTSIGNLFEKVFENLIRFIQVQQNFSSRNWQDGNGGQVKWAFGCDFDAKEIAQQDGPGEQCGGFCLANSLCTHFTWSSNVCHLKRFSGGSAADTNADGGTVCGYVVVPSLDHWLYNLMSYLIGLFRPLIVGESELGALIWQEEFDTFDATRCKSLVTGWRGGNDEFQYYANRSENRQRQKSFPFMQRS